MRKSLLVTILLSVSACGASSSTGESAAFGGLVGAGAGAGAGAIIAEATGGSVGTGVAIGGGAGVPLGILAGIAIHEHQKDTVLSENEEAIADNTARIRSNQQSLDETREEIDIENRSIQPDASRAEKVWDGPTVGQYNR